MENNSMNKPDNEKEGLVERINRLVELFKTNMGFRIMVIVGACLILLIGSITAVAIRNHKIETARLEQQANEEARRKADTEKAKGLIDEGKYLEAQGILRYIDTDEARELLESIDVDAAREYTENMIDEAEKYFKKEEYISAYNSASSAYNKAVDYEFTELEERAKQLVDEIKPFSDQAKAALETPEPTSAPTAAPTPTPAPQQDAAASSGSTALLDRQYTGDGFVISYSSSMTIDDSIMDFMVVDSDSGSSVSVLKVPDAGPIDGMTKADFEAELADSGLSVTITDFFSVNINGLNCYGVEYDLLGNTVTQICAGDGIDAYFLTVTEVPGISSDKLEILEETALSFDIP